MTPLSNDSNVTRRLDQLRERRKFDFTLTHSYKQFSPFASHDYRFLILLRADFRTKIHPC